MQTPCINLTHGRTSLGIKNLLSMWLAIAVWFGRGKTIQSTTALIPLQAISCKTMPFRRTSYFIWEFILAMLQEEECSSIISWTKESDLEFEIKDMGELAQYWGMLRGRPEMDKKSFFRAFRYYYKINVIKKVKSGRRLYRFNNYPYKASTKNADDRGKSTKSRKIEIF